MKTPIAVGLFLLLSSMSSAKGTCALNECSTTDGCPISKSNLLTTLPTLNKEFFVSVEFKATAWQSGWQTVIHFTEDGNCCKVGQRVPGLWVSNSGQLYPRFAVNGNGDFGIMTTKKYPLNQWITVQFSQTLENGKYIYRVLIDGKSEIEVVNSQPKIFSNVKVYSSDPWYNALKGSMRNLIVNADGSKNCGGGSGNSIPPGVRPIPGCDCSDQKERNHLGGNIGACLTTLKGKFWCYLDQGENSRCPDKKKSSRPGNLWWGYKACEWYTEFQPIEGK